MPLTMDEFQKFGKRTVLSPEETADAEAYYQQHRQMNGLGHVGKAHGACCDSCAKGGPCENCGHPQPCGCGKRGRDRGGLRGLGAAPVTIMWGAGERDSQDLRTPDSGFMQTVAPGAVNRYLSRPHGQVGLERRVALTRMIEELEALTGTAGVHPRVLAQKVWAARRALMGAGQWESADYADPRQAYDDKQDLEQRLLVIERLLGVAQLSPRLQAAAGSGMFSGLGGLGTWNQPYMDPVNKLASCISGALCHPCCPPGTQRKTEIRFAQPEQAWVTPQSTWLPPPTSDTRIPLEASDTWLPPPPREETRVQPPPIPLEETWAQPPPPPIGVIPGTTLKPVVEETKILAMWRPKGNYYGPGSTGALPHNQTFVRDQTGRSYVAIRDGNSGVFVRFTTPGEAPSWAVGQLAQLNAHLPPLQVQQAPATKPQVSQTPGSYNELIQALPQAQTSTGAAQSAYLNQFIQSTGGRVTGGAGAAAAAGGATAMRTGMFGLGAMPLIGMSSVNDLRAKLRQARQEIARRRA